MTTPLSPSRSKYLMRQFGLLSEQMSNPPFETHSSGKTQALGYNLTLYEYYNTQYTASTNEEKEDHEDDENGEDEKDHEDGDEMKDKKDKKDKKDT